MWLFHIEFIIAEFSSSTQASRMKNNFVVDLLNVLFFSGNKLDRQIMLFPVSRSASKWRCSSTDEMQIILFNLYTTLLDKKWTTTIVC